MTENLRNGKIYHAQRDSNFLWQPTKFSKKDMFLKEKKNWDYYRLQYFINISPQLASTIPQNSENTMQLIKKAPS